MPKRHFIFMFAMLLTSGCGTRQNQAKNGENSPAPQGVQAADANPAATTTQTIPASSSQPEATSTAQVAIASPAMLVGTFQQVDNMAVKVTIDQNLLVATNIVIPITPAGGGRLTPLLPQRLKVDPTNQFYMTDGTFNRPGGQVDDMVFRVDSYSEGSLLDVTLVVQVRASDSLSYVPFVNTNNSSVMNLCGSDKPLPPAPPPVPPPPPPPDNQTKCCCCTCSSGDCSKNGGGGFEPTKQMLFLYHFVRV